MELNQILEELQLLIIIICEGNRSCQMMNISKLNDDIMEVKKHFEAATAIDSCTFCLGLTGSGKSSLISYLCGAEITSNRGEDGNYHLTHNDAKFPIIGNTATSCTTIPKLYRLNDRCAYYDPPGFLDSKGVDQEILNAYSIARMFNLGMKAKICIVIEQSSLETARGGPLLQVIRRLVELFDDFESVMSSCILVISKVNLFDLQPSNIIYKIKTIRTSLQKTIQGQPSKEQRLCYDLVNFLIEKNRIEIFPQPKSITSESIAKLKIRFQKLEGFTVISPPNIIVSQQSKVCLEQYVKEQASELEILASVIGNRHFEIIIGKQYAKDDLKQDIARTANIQTMLRNRQLQSGQPEKIEELQVGLSILPEHLQAIKQIMAHLNFCCTIYQKLVIPTQLTEILLKSTIKTEVYLHERLTSIEGKEQAERVRLENEEKMAIRQAQWDETVRLEKQKQESRVNQLIEARAQQNRQRCEQLGSSCNTFMIKELNKGGIIHPLGSFDHLSTFQQCKEQNYQQHLQPWKQI